VTRVAAILWAKTRIGVNQIASVRNESKLKVGVVSISAVLLWFGAYVAFWSAFRWLKQYEIDAVQPGYGIGEIIMSRMLSVFALALFFMLLFSNTLIAYSTLYKARENAFLVQAPVPWWEYFLARFVECVAFSSWASAYLGSPMMLAYGLIEGSPWPFYIAAVAFYVPFVTLPAAAGAIIAMALVRVFPRLPRGSMIGVGIIAVVCLFTYLRGNISVEQLADPQFQTIRQTLDRTQSWILPSYWAAHGVLAASAGDYSESWFYFLLLLSNALMILLVAAAFADRVFYPGWSDLLGNDMNRKTPPGRGWVGRIDALLRWLWEPHRALVTKDIKLFWRDTTQWSQFVLFFGIMAVYVASLRDRASVVDDAKWRTLIICLNIGACTLILATLTSRFVYPLISLEGRRFWVVGLAPLTFRQLMRQKFWLSVCTTSMFTISLVVLSCYMLKVEPIFFALSLYSIVIANFGLSGLAVGLGSLFPNFQEDNPARIVSGMGGTLNFLLSMAYITLVVGTQTTVMIFHQRGLFSTTSEFHKTLAAVVIGLAIVSAVTTFLPMRLGLRNLEQSEY
jgi:ABC-2 type transport system permease protein